MSYTHLDAMNDTNDLMVSALNSKDMTYVAEVADKLAEIDGWEVEVEVLRGIVKQANREDWAYDESINN